MKIVTIDDKKYYTKTELGEYNNLADKPTEFINFINLLCKKYKLNISKMAKFDACERNLGVELQNANIMIQFFYEYDYNILELMIIIKDKEIKQKITTDINTYVNKVTYKVGDKVVDNYGEFYIMQEDINKPSHHLKRYKAIRVLDKAEVEVYNNYICPDLN